MKVLNIIIGICEIIMIFSLLVIYYSLTYKIIINITSNIYFTYVLIVGTILFGNHLYTYLKKFIKEN